MMTAKPSPKLRAARAARIRRRSRRREVVWMSGSDDKDETLRRRRGEIKSRLRRHRRSPPPARAARGGEGSGVGGAACSAQVAFVITAHIQSKRRPPTPRSAASLRRSTLPANGREGDDRNSLLNDYKLPAPNVSHAATVPCESPRSNQRWRCAPLPWV